MDSARNLYKNDVDFAELGKQDAEFQRHLKPNGQLDFSDPEAVQALTIALLRRDFNLQISLPPDRLCPPIPNRLNYLLWIQDLLDSTSNKYSDRHEPSREVIGLDVGTGASCIYPLLGCAQNSKWRFIGTDIDEKSFAFAKKNVECNNLNDRIKLHASEPGGHILPFSDINAGSVDFTMCNPPFYSSAVELAQSASLKQRPPNSACTGAPIEMVCAGGEVAFVSKMILESLDLKDRVQWFTSMLGKFSSVEAIVDLLRKSGVDNWAVMEFVQGSRTRRWAVGWSFEDLRPRMKTARGIASLAKHLMPFPSEYHIQLQTPPIHAIKALNSALTELDLQWRWKDAISTGVGFATKNVWSRAARRKIAKAPATDDETGDEEDAMAFGFKVHVAEAVGDHGGSNITIRWLKGIDSVLFESFCGMVKRKLAE